MSRWTDSKQWSLTFALAACGLGSSPLLANAQVPITSLPEAEARLSRPFERITGLHELPDGRVVVVDANEQSVLLVDFARNSVLQLGRNGSGPSEYRFPFRLFRLGGDSIGIDDGGNKRILVLTRDAKFGGILSSTGMRMGSQAPPRVGQPTASDGHGHLFTLGFSLFTTLVSKSAIPDSAPIERWRVGASARDTVAWLPLPPRELLETAPGEGTRAFVAIPEWSVGLDGQIAILHVDPYAVDQVTAKGQRVRGRPISYQPIRLTEAHKRQWREEATRLVSVTVTTPRGITSAELRPGWVQEPVQWPAYLPPFLERGRFAPDGLLWIQRTTQVDAPEVFDLVDPRGVVVQRVSTPPHTRLIEFGQEHVYFVRIDADDQEFLERYKAIPAGKP